MAATLIVAIDYGTTFTSVAYALQKQEKEIIPIEINRDWPPSSAEYIPSQVAYHKTLLNKITWGRHIEFLQNKSNWNIVNFAKAKIHNCEENKRLLKIKKWSDENESDEHYKPIKDMLRCVYDHVVGAKGSVVRNVMPQHLANLEIKFICGVPSAWTIPEQLVFVDLMSQAGMPNAMRVPEPEAMAAWYFHRYKSFEVGDIIVVVDAGGGTVDMISYKVKSVEPLQLTDCATYEGDCCGSTFLNLRFEKLVEEKLKHMDVKQEDSPLAKINHRFENAFKSTFTGAESFEYRTGPSESGEPLTASSKELRQKVFDPVFRRMIQLLSKQIDLTSTNLEADWKLEKKTDSHLAPFVMRIDQILLGGGLSANPYLLDKVRAKFPNITVQRMPDSRTDVAKGLACIGCGHRAIKQHRSMLNYGVITQYRWDESLPDLDSLLGGVDEHTGIRYYPVVEWLIRKGQPISDHSTFERARIESWDEHDDWTLIHEIVVTKAKLDLDIASTNWVDIEDHEIFEKRSDLSQVNRSRFKQEFGRDGTRRWVINTLVEFVVRRGALFWNMKAPVSTREDFVRDFPLENNPYPALGSLLTKGLKVPPETHTQSLIEVERAERANRKRKEPSTSPSWDGDDAPRGEKTATKSSHLSKR